MDIQNTNQQLQIDKATINQNPASSRTPQQGDVKFADELTKAKEDNKKNDEGKNAGDVKLKEKSAETDKPKSSPESTENKKSNKETEEINNAFDGLEDAVKEINKISQKDENNTTEVKISNKTSDTEIEENSLIDNDMNIQEPADKINLQTETGTNFNNNGQPFAEFVNNGQQNDGLKSTDKELAEEKAILSTMEENVAIARKNMLLKEKASKNNEQEENTQNKQPVQQKNITVQNDTGIKKVDTKTHLTVDTVVSYENVVMDKADVDFFVNLVEKGSVNLSDVQATQKSAQVSKTLADLLAKAMNENKPVRIDFDNDISVIIKIDRAGKISADFLPSSQIAEAYLKENLPLLKQRFDDNNINYNELNQRKQKQDTQDNRKKGRKDE